MYGQQFGELNYLNLLLREYKPTVCFILFQCAQKLNPVCFKDSRKVLKIRLTTQWHFMQGLITETVVKEKDMYRILYSMHSSLEEIQDLVNCLQPHKVTPIAKPDKISEEEVCAILTYITQHFSLLKLVYD